MKKEERNILKDKTLAELEKMSHDSRERLRALRLDLFAGKVKNVAELRMLRKDIARIATNITAKQNHG